MIRFIFCLLSCVLIFSTAPATAETIEVYNPSGVRMGGTYVDDALVSSMRSQGLGKPALAGQFPHTRTEILDVDGDASEYVNNLFYQRGWTDGLPIIPPTPERVANMLRGSNLSGNFVLAELDPLGGQATIEKIAINAVMAGCAPQHMPVLMAAVEAVALPEFDLRGMSTTTGHETPFMIISGPIVEQLGLNAGSGTFGRGTRANAVISRAFHLILQNVGGSWAGVNDMSTMGQPGEFVMLFAENAEANPWASFHTERRQQANANVVTVAGADGWAGVLGIGQSPEGFLKLVASWLAGQDRAWRSAFILVIAQDTAQFLYDNGWDRNSMRAFIREHAQVPFGVFKEQYIDTKMIYNRVPAEILSLSDPDQLVPKPYYDELIIIVAGGTGEKSMILPCWSGGRPISQEILLPGNWETLLEEARNSDLL